MTATAAAPVHIAVDTPWAVADGIAMCGAVRAVASSGQPRIHVMNPTFDGVSLAGDLLTAMAWLNTQYDPEGLTDDIRNLAVTPIGPSNVDTDLGLWRWDAGVTCAPRGWGLALDAKIIRCGLSLGQAGDLIAALVGAEQFNDHIRDMNIEADNNKFHLN